MWTLIIIFVVVVVVDDDTDYWVYLSSDHLFQVYYNVRQVLLQSATAFFITKCNGLLLQSATAFLLQSAMVCYYKVRQVLQSVTILLQSATGITKCEDYYKVRQYSPWQQYQWMVWFSSTFWLGEYCLFHSNLTKLTNSHYKKEKENFDNVDPAEHSRTKKG